MRWVFDPAQSVVEFGSPRLGVGDPLSHPSGSSTLRFPELRPVLVDTMLSHHAPCPTPLYHGIQKVVSSGRCSFSSKSFGSRLAYRPVASNPVQTHRSVESPQKFPRPSLFAGRFRLTPLDVRLVVCEPALMRARRTSPRPRSLSLAVGADQQRLPLKRIFSFCSFCRCCFWRLIAAMSWWESRRLQSVLWVWSNPFSG